MSSNLIRALSVVLAALMVACSGATPGPTASGAPTGAVASGTPVDQAIAYAKTNLPTLTPEIIRAAANEGSVVLVMQNFGTAQWDEFNRLFTAHFPFIKVERTEQTAAQVMSRFQAEVGSNRGQGDIFLAGSSAVMPDLIAKGQVATWKINDESQFADAYKASGYWYALQDQRGVTVYRKGSLKPGEYDKLKTWQGIGDPAFKGRLGVADIATGAYVAGSSYMLQKRLPKGVWDAFAANKPKIRSGLTPTLDGLLAGDYDIVVMASTVTTSRLQQTGAPIEFLETTPTYGNPSPQFISALAPHMNAARLYQEWSLSKEAQTAWPALIGTPSARKDIQDTRTYMKEPWYVSAPESIALDWADVTKTQKEVADKFAADLK